MKTEISVIGTGVEPFAPEEIKIEFIIPVNSLSKFYAQELLDIKGINTKKIIEILDFLWKEHEINRLIGETKDKLKK